VGLDDVELPVDGAELQDPDFEGPGRGRPVDRRHRQDGQRQERKNQDRAARALVPHGFLPRFSGAAATPVHWAHVTD
jgi:hypothetical protein